MDALRFTLISEGTSDENLLPILAWAIRQQGVLVAKGQFARWDMLPKKPATVAEKIIAGIDLYACDLLFIHRDADQAGFGQRTKEIENALVEVKKSRIIQFPAVPVIPIRETEAWLLIDERAIRLAASNPNGTRYLMLPSLKNIEKCADPKKELERVLRAASGRSPQRLKKFDTRSAMARVVEHISDFSLLRTLSAFQNLELDLAALRARGWQ